MEFIKSYFILKLPFGGGKVRLYWKLQCLTSRHRSLQFGIPWAQFCSDPEAGFIVLNHEKEYAYTQLCFSNELKAELVFDFFRASIDCVTSICHATLIMLSRYYFDKIRADKVKGFSDKASMTRLAVIENSQVLNLPLKCPKQI